MVAQALAEIVKQREVETRIGKLKAQGIFPVHASAHRLRGLAIREPFDLWHDGHKSEAPGGNLHGSSVFRIEISKECIVIKVAKRF